MKKGNITMNIYSIKDKAIGFDGIFTANNDFHALRMANDTVNAPEQLNQPMTLIQKHPEDYDLYCLGKLNTDTGEITPETRFMQNLLDLKKVDKKA
ncbi:nonstructural protein [Microvirus mar39]|uniref:Nonstructural protein n=1 Tax=Microvirus mar39 TaxID=2851173 RepID=A0A8F5RC26_9VIRU|nr:nonstructural protein [Microvirus mar39]